MLVGVSKMVRDETRGTLGTATLNLTRNFDVSELRNNKVSFTQVIGILTVSQATSCYSATFNNPEPLKSGSKTKKPCLWAQK